MFKLYRNFEIIFIYFAVLQWKAVQNEKIVKLLGITCETAQPQYLNYTQCKVEHVGRDIYEVTIAIAMHLGPVNNASLVATVVKSGYENRKPLVEYQIDGCEFFRAKRRNFFAKFVYRIMGLEQYSNMNHSCPYDHDLTLDHYPFNGKTVGKVVPFGNGIFSFNTKWYSYNILRAVVNIRYQTFDR